MRIAILVLLLTSCSRTYETITCLEWADRRASRPWGNPDPDMLRVLVDGCVRDLAGGNEICDSRDAHGVCWRRVRP